MKPDAMASGFIIRNCTFYFNNFTPRNDDAVGSQAGVSRGVEGYCAGAVLRRGWLWTAWVAPCNPLNTQPSNT